MKYSNTTRHIKHWLTSLAGLSLLLLLTACGGSSGGGASYTIGGTVSGMSGSGLVIKNNGGDNLSITGNGSFTFKTSVANGGSYSVTVSSHASGQTCRVKSGSGTVSGSNVTNVAINCGVDPTGYYTGSVTNDTNDITDAQVLVNDTRLMIVSDAEVVLYDGEMTIIGSDYTATLTVYKNGQKIGTTSASGSIVKGSQINTTTLTGSGYGQGTFVATYDTTYNSRAASLGTIGGTQWAAGLNESLSDYKFDIDANGNLTHFSNATSLGFRSCQMNGTILPIGTTHLYAVNITISNCHVNNADVDGNFTGLAATKDGVGTDDRLVFTISDGTYSTGDDFILQ